MNEDHFARAILAIRNGLVGIVEQLNDILAEMAPGVRIPQIDLAELDQAGWISFQTKQPAEPGKAAWTKNPAAWPGLQLPAVLTELSKALEKLEKEKPAGAPAVSLKLGDMEYNLSKPDVDGFNRFIQRKPAKQEKGGV